MKPVLGYTAVIQTCRAAPKDAARTKTYAWGKNSILVAFAVQTAALEIRSTEAATNHS